MCFSAFIKGQFQVFSRKRYLIPFIILLLGVGQYSYREMAMAFDSFLVEPLVDSPGKTVGSDFNGDGIHDMLMGANRNNDGPGANNAGAVYLLYGADTLSATYQLNGGGVNVTILGKAALDYLGLSIASAGDLNSDGFDDIVMGAILNDDAATSAGAVYILYGSPNLSATYDLVGIGVNVTILGKAASDTLGYSVGGAGDVNGDGFDDVVMAADKNDDGAGANNGGAVYILYGSASLSATYQLNGAGVNVTLLGKAALDQLGFGPVGCTGAGDVNRDGFDDIIAGAYGNNDGGTDDEGATYVLFGGSSLSATIRLDGAGANLTILGKAVNDFLGFSNSGVGDINGDGFDDFATGAGDNDDSALDAGAAYLIYGRSGFPSGTIDTGNSEEDVSILGKAASDSLGRTTGPVVAGDINDDGLYDLIVDARLNDDGPGDNPGASYVIYGSTSLASSIPAGNSNITLLGKAAGNYLGRASRGAGDVNNDGFPDFVVGAYLNADTAATAGAVYIVFGSDSPSAIINADGLGTNVTILGKANDDRFGISVGGGRSNPGP